MYAELFSGLHEDPRAHLQKFFTEKYDEVVLVRDISFNSMCEHHMLPFMGQAHIGYMPNGRVIGLSKLARVVEVVARRPQVQERMTETIANLLVEELQAKGVAVVIEATHTCMTIRGIRKPGSLCVTSAMKGIFRSNLSSRSEDDELDLRRTPLTRVRSRAGAPSAVAILTQFVLRLSFGLALGMALTSPRQVTSGYYRNHLYVLLGLDRAGDDGGAGAAERVRPCRRRWSRRSPATGLGGLAIRKAASGHRAVGIVSAASLWGAMRPTALPAGEPVPPAAALAWLDPPTSGLVLG